MFSYFSTSNDEFADFSSAFTRSTTLNSNIASLCMLLLFTNILQKYLIYIVNLSIFKFLLYS